MASLSSVDSREFNAFNEAEKFTLAHWLVKEVKKLEELFLTRGI